MENKHPSTHKFLEVDTICTKLLKYLGSWAKNKEACSKISMKFQDDSTLTLLKQNNEEEGKEIEVNGLDSLFKIYKLRESKSAKPNQKSFPQI